ncbi:AraC family transcriptional regulator [Gordonia sp. HY002]|uniref:helix-turn-helix domain-containing protein n=1 Tax=Gordonia zhenghanii TaxID=2911516 RepID=UPI001EEFB757|nr:helix-turn-helix domain-containing protein [Gordonia zhenghanii]MCF8572031.1 AraC family transcriptional regulator [Gordonia zhenghanii]MCF8604305.1 AraC family transcriptional regulator [Gordonia zhenghanii]
MSRNTAAATRRLQRSVTDAIPAGLGAHTLLPGLIAYRGSGKTFRLPNAGRPYALVVLEGALTINQLGNSTQYSPGDFLISEIHTPPVAETNDLPWTVLVYEYTSEEIALTLLRIDEIGSTSRATRQTLDTEESRLLFSLHRLIELSDETEGSFLQELVRNEISYRLLTGVHGAAVATSITGFQIDFDIVNINGWIKRNFRQSFSVEDLARASGMSASSFHRKFRDVVQMGPVRCQKVLRLSEARRLLLEGAASVSDVAVMVGYESASQFTREYKREFGKSPRQDITHLQERLHRLAERGTAT